MQEQDTQQKEFEEMIKLMMKPSDVRLSDVKKDQLKERVFARINSHVRLENTIKAVSGDITLDAYSRVTLKERILSLIEASHQKRFFWLPVFNFTKKLVSVAMVLILTLGITMMGILQVNVGLVSAAGFTSIASVEGNAWVQRGGQIIQAVPGLKVLENDIVKTEGGQLVIKYLDNSVSRLADDTEIVVKKLAAEHNNSTRTQVKIYLEDGEVWSKVVNLLEADSEFLIETKDVLATAKKAAFTVKVSNEQSQIGVFNHSLEVTSENKIGRIITGEKLIIDEGKDLLAVQPISEDERNGKWVTQNMENDQIYLQELETQFIVEQTKSLGVDNIEDFSVDKSFREKTLLMLTFDDIDRAKLELDIAEKNFIAARLQLQNPAISPEDKLIADALMQEFSLQVEGFYQLINEVKEGDDAYAKDLGDYVEDKLLAQKKYLSLSLPGAPEYEARKIVDSLELLRAGDKNELVQIKVDQANEKLSVVEDIKQAGNQELAQTVMDEYKADMKGLINILGDLNPAEKALSEDVVANVSRDIDVLEAIDVVSSGELIELKVDVAQATGVNEIIEPAIVESGNTYVQTVKETSVPETAVVQEYRPEEVTDGPYGVKLQGDKPLPPMFTN
ncbi:MAG: FecR domain-containing protein [Patescibacteria group bacterium]